nr:Clp protease N-terminal domain-containing protein [bacterium]
MISFDKLTVKSQEALNRAQQLASEHGQQQIEPVHLLFVLLEPADAMGRTILKKIGEEPDVVKNRAAFQARYGTALNNRIAGEWEEGSLSDGGEEIRLNARDGSPVLAFRYQDDDGWPGRADGTGSSLEYTGTGFSTADYQTGSNWRASGEIHGTP